MANILPLSPTANFQLNVKLICWEILSGSEYLLFKYRKAFLIVPVVGKITPSFLHF